MTDEKFIESFWKVHNYCEQQRSCPTCKFRVNKNGGACQFRILAHFLSAPPCNWNMEEIEKITKL